MALAHSQSFCFTDTLLESLSPVSFHGSLHVAGGSDKRSSVCGPQDHYPPLIIKPFQFLKAQSTTKKLWTCNKIQIFFVFFFPQTLKVGEVGGSGDRYHPNFPEGHQASAGSRQGASVTFWVWNDIQGGYIQR